MSTHIIKLDNILEKGASKDVLRLLMTAMLRHNRKVFLDMGGKVYHMHCGGIESQCGGRRLQLMEYPTALVDSPIVLIPADVANRDDLMLSSHSCNDFPEEGISLMAVELRDRDDLAKWVVFLDAMFEEWAGSGVEYTHDWCVTGDRADAMLLFVAHHENEWEHATEPPECEADFNCQMCGSEVDEYGWCTECEETSHDPYDVCVDEDYYYASEDESLTGCRYEDYENHCVSYVNNMNGLYAPTYIENGFGISYYTQSANVGDQTMQFVYELGPSRYQSTVGWGVESICGALVYSLSRHLLARGHTFISCNVGDPGADTLASMIELYENQAELKHWGVAIVQPEGYATNPNERHHYIDSMILVVEDSVKLSMFQNTWEASINQRLEAETCEHAA